MAEAPRDAYQYCPRCGANEFAPSGGNCLSCAACSFNWYYNVAAAVDVIIANDVGEILTTRRARDPHKGKLDLPGGFVDAGETLEQAARREVLEEVGVDLDVLTYLGSFPNEYAFGGVIYYALDIILTARAPTGTLRVGDDVASARFMAPKSIEPGDVGLDSTRAALQFYLQSR